VKTDHVEAADKADVLFLLHEPSSAWIGRVDYSLENRDGNLQIELEQLL
jgi:hypothetical protein